MEIVAELIKPFTEKQRRAFVIEFNHRGGLKIEETDIGLAAMGETEEERLVRERSNLDKLTLTPSDVERALLQAKGMDFDDLKNALKGNGFSDAQVKAVGVELRANTFYRGAMLGDVRIVDAIGELLGYTSEDMDYLFKNKTLPVSE